jgi:D-galactarolactone cycloisomerase
VAAITRGEVFVLVHELEEERGPSIAFYRQRESVLVRLTDADGVTGWGETYLLPGIADAIAEGAAVVAGMTADAWRVVVPRLRAATFSSYATSALSIALDDLRGRRRGVPVSALYGGPTRSAARAYASSSGYLASVPPGETWPDEVAAHVAAGFTAVKFRIGRYPVRDEAPILERIRVEHGPGLDLMADGNAAYTPAQAVQVGHVLARLDFRWLEEPLPQAGYAGYEVLRTRLELPLAGGESVETPLEAHALLRRNGVDIIQPDVTICGGIGEALRIADLAAMDAVRFVPHAWGGAIAVAATLQLLAVLPDPTRSPATEVPLLELDVGVNPFRTELLGEPVSLRADGMVAIPTGPGLGVEVDEAFVRRHATVTREIALA